MMIRKLCLLALLPACTLAAANDAAQSAAAAPLTRDEALAQSKRADELRKDANTRQNEAESIRLRDYNACLDKLLVNACRDDVRTTFIKTMESIRKQELEANELGRNAKARLNELNDAERQAPKPGGKPAGLTNSNPKPLPKPAGKPATAASPAQSMPSATVSPAAQARADAERVRKEKAAGQERNTNAQTAAKRAEQAAKDRARYESRQREHTEKMAKRASSSSKKASASGPAAQ